MYTLDARNHGSSDHVSQMDYNSMSHDTVQFCKDHSLERVSLLGKSSLYMHDMIMIFKNFGFKVIAWVERQP